MIQNFKYKDEQLNKSYIYFKDLLDKHSKAGITDIMLAASDLAIKKNMITHTRKIKKIDFIEILNDAVDLLLDSAEKDDIRMTVKEQIQFEQLILRAKEILIEEKGDLKC